MNHLEQIRLRAAEALTTFVNTAQPKSCGRGQLQAALPVVDAIATYAVAGHFADPDCGLVRAAMAAAAADVADRKRLPIADGPGTTPDPTPDG